MTTETDSNKNNDVLFPIENWQNEWPFRELWLLTIYRHMLVRNFPKYGSFVELIVDAFDLHADEDGFPLTCYKNAITEYPDEINENLCEQGFSNVYLKDGKLYYRSFGLPIDKQLEDLTKIQTFRIDHLDYITIVVLASKICIKKDIKDFNTNRVLTYDIIRYLYCKQTSSHLKQFIKTMPGLDKNVLQETFITTLKSKRLTLKNQAQATNRWDIISNTQCLANILFCLNVKQEIILKLLENYNKSDSLNEIIQYLESTSVTTR